MRFFKLQMLDDDNKINYVDEVLLDNRITSNLEYAKDKFDNLIAGDIVLVHKGNAAHALVEISHKITNNDEIKGMSFGTDYRVRILDLFSNIKNNSKFTVGKNKIGFTGTFNELIDKDTPTYQFVYDWYSLTRNKNMIKNISKLISRKKQIILQGPPGTGKTRLAKKIAKILTKASEKINPIEKIDSFFKGENNCKNAISINDAKELLEKFHESFPQDNLANMKISDYSIGNGQNNSFCWWIERGLKPLGYYSPGNSTSYLIYWSKSKDTYSIHGKNLKELSEEDAIKLLTQKLYLLVKDEDYNGNVGMFGESFMLKILHSYYPDKYFPINSDNCMNNVLNIFNISSKGLTRLEKNLKIQEIYKTKLKEYNSNVSSYEFMSFLFENFDLKGNVEIKNAHIILEGKSKLIQFHPSYTYEDFVRGITVKSEGKNISYKTENRILAQMAKEAFENPSRKFVLIIDEINRANLSSALGELIYALEYRGEPVESMYEMEDGENTIILPPNLYIIGTMNTADRSVGQIDYAIRRRFAFVDVLPEVIDESTLDNGLKFETNLFNKVKAIFVDDDNHLSDEFKAKDVQLGHSYFIYNEKDGFDMNLEYEIKPILREYVADGILKETALKVIENL